MASDRSVTIVGAGVFGLAAALELRRRNWDVTVLEADSSPAPRAASTDLSKIVRCEYGTDRATLQLAAEALEGWRQWNRLWPEPLFHETGVAFLRCSAMTEDSYEWASWGALTDSGFVPERLTGKTIPSRFPAWREGYFEDGFFHAQAGWVESGRLIAWLASRAHGVGARLVSGAVVGGLLTDDSKVCGVRTTDGVEHRSRIVVVAAGAWTGQLLGLEWGLRATGHPVFHLAPESPEQFIGSRFPVFTADISRTGWYGFPLHATGVVKVGRHAAGRAVSPDTPREVAPESEAELRDFLAEALPALASAPIVSRRLCLYCDTADGHFWIDRDPERPTLVVAGGGSGHGFKFAPLLGPWIADVVEGQPPPDDRFGWRREESPFAGEEEARAQSVV